MSPYVPAKVFHDISTFESVMISLTKGAEGSRRDMASAQRQRTCQFLIPVVRLSQTSWSRAGWDRRIVSSDMRCSGGPPVARLHGCGERGVIVNEGVGVSKRGLKAT